MTYRPNREEDYSERNFNREQSAYYPPGQATQDFVRLSMAMSQAGVELVAGASSIFGSLVLNMTNSLLYSAYPPVGPSRPLNLYDDRYYAKRRDTSSVVGKAIRDSASVLDRATNRFTTHYQENLYDNLERDAQDAADYEEEVKARARRARLEVQAAEEEVERARKIKEYAQNRMVKEAAERSEEMTKRSREVTEEVSKKTPRASQKSEHVNPPLED